MYVVTKQLLSFNWRRFTTLHNNNNKKKSWIVQKNTEFYELIELPSHEARTLSFTLHKN